MKHNPSLTNITQHYHLIRYAKPLNPR